MKKKIQPARAKEQRPRRPHDVNQLAHQLIRESTERAGAPSPTDADISRVMAELGRRGGKVGGKRRAERMTEEERSNAAALAAKARWAKKS